MQPIDPVSIGFRLIILFFAIGIHEFAHCKFADLAGDPTPRYYGRVTLNLFKHFEPMGTLMMLISSVLGFGIGWGRPAPMDPRKMHNPRWDFFIAVAAGPLSNLAQAIVFGCVYRILFGAQDINPLGVVGQVQMFLLLAVIINVSLMIFNLIPFGPLDGHYLLGLLMPEKPRLQWFMFNQRVGIAGLFLIVMILNFSKVDILSRPVFAITSLLIGHRLL